MGGRNAKAPPARAAPAAGEPRDDDARRIINLADVPLKDNGNGKSFQARVGRVGPMLGLAAIGCTLTVVPAGKRAYPFHRHHVCSELFYILSGSGEVRLDDRTLPVRAGDLIASPAGARSAPDRQHRQGRAALSCHLGHEFGRRHRISRQRKMAVAAGIKNADFDRDLQDVGHVKPADYFEGEEPVREPAAAKLATGSR